MMRCGVRAVTADSAEISASPESLTASRESWVREDQGQGDGVAQNAETVEKDGSTGQQEDSRGMKKFPLIEEGKIREPSRDRVCRVGKSHPGVSGQEYSPMQQTVAMLVNTSGAVNRIAFNKPDSRQGPRLYISESGKGKSPEKQARWSTDLETTSVPMFSTTRRTVAEILDERESSLAFIRCQMTDRAVVPGTAAMHSKCPGALLRRPTKRIFLDGSPVGADGRHIGERLACDPLGRSVNHFSSLVGEDSKRKRARKGANQSFIAYIPKNRLPEVQSKHNTRALDQHPQANSQWSPVVHHSSPRSMERDDQLRNDHRIHVASDAATKKIAGRESVEKGTANVGNVQCRLVKHKLLCTKATARDPDNEGSVFTNIDSRLHITSAADIDNANQSRTEKRLFAQRGSSPAFLPKEEDPNRREEFGDKTTQNETTWDVDGSEHIATGNRQSNLDPRHRSQLLLRSSGSHCEDLKGLAGRNDNCHCLSSALDICKEDACSVWTRKEGAQLPVYFRKHSETTTVARAVPSVDPTTRYLVENATDYEECGKLSTGRKQCRKEFDQSQVLECLVTKPVNPESNRNKKRGRGSQQQRTATNQEHVESQSLHSVRTKSKKMFGREVQPTLARQPLLQPPCETYVDFDSSPLRNRSTGGCPGCKRQIKPLHTGPDGYRTLCKTCSAKYAAHTLPVFLRPDSSISAAFSAGCHRAVVVGFVRPTVESCGRLSRYRDLLRPIVRPAHTSDRHIDIPSRPHERTSHDTVSESICKAPSTCQEGCKSHSVPHTCLTKGVGRHVSIDKTVLVRNPSRHTAQSRAGEGHDNPAGRTYSRSTELQKQNATRQAIDKSIPTQMCSATVDNSSTVLALNCTDATHTEDTEHRRSSPFVWHERTTEAIDHAVPRAVDYKEDAMNAPRVRCVQSTMTLIQQTVGHVLDSEVGSSGSDSDDCTKSPQSPSHTHSHINCFQNVAGYECHQHGSMLNHDDPAKPSSYSDAISRAFKEPSLATNIAPRPRTRELQPRRKYRKLAKDRAAPGRTKARQYVRSSASSAAQHFHPTSRQQPTAPVGILPLTSSYCPHGKDLRSPLSLAFRHGQRRLPLNCASAGSTTGQNVAGITRQLTRDTALLADRKRRIPLAPYGNGAAGRLVQNKTSIPPLTSATYNPRIAPQSPGMFKCNSSVAANPVSRLCEPGRLQAKSTNISRLPSRPHDAIGPLTIQRPNCALPTPLLPTTQSGTVFRQKPRTQYVSSFSPILRPQTSKRRRTGMRRLGVVPDPKGTWTHSAGWSPLKAVTLATSRIKPIGDRVESRGIRGEPNKPQHAFRAKQLFMPSCSGARKPRSSPLTPTTAERCHPPQDSPPPPFYPLSPPAVTSPNSSPQPSSLSCSPKSPSFARPRNIPTSRTPPPQRSIPRCNACRAVCAPLLTGPDGHHTLCRTCGSLYRTRQLPLFQDTSGKVSVQPLPNGWSVVTVGFQSLSHSSHSGMPDLLNPIIRRAAPEDQPEALTITRTPRSVPLLRTYSARRKRKPTKAMSDAERVVKRAPRVAKPQCAHVRYDATRRARRVRDSSRDPRARSLRQKRRPRVGSPCTPSDGEDDTTNVADVEEIVKKSGKPMHGRPRHGTRLVNSRELTRAQQGECEKRVEPAPVLDAGVPQTRAIPIAAKMFQVRATCTYGWRARMQHLMVTTSVCFRRFKRLLAEALKMKSAFRICYVGEDWEEVFVESDAQMTRMFCMIRQLRGKALRVTLMPPARKKRQGRKGQGVDGGSGRRGDEERNLRSKTDY